MKWTLKRIKPCQGLQSGSIYSGKTWLCDTCEYDDSLVQGYLCGDLFYHLSTGTYFLKNEMNKLRNEKLPALYNSENELISWLVYKNTSVYKNITIRELNDWITIGRQVGINQLDNQQNAIIRIMHEIDKVFYRNEILELEII